MEIKYFKEYFHKDFGSIFEEADVDAMLEAADLDTHEVVDAETVLNNLADYKDDAAFKSFVRSITRANSIVVFMRDGVRHGMLANIFEIIAD